MNKLITSIIALVFIAGMSSCVKDNFDAPPTGGKDPDIAVNFFIDSLKSRYTGAPTLISEDLVISAIVTADDKSGNFYKQIIIQDTSGGIALLLEGSNAFNDYPIGRRIFIKLRGLYITQYKGLYQIASSILPDGSTDGIPLALYDKFILKGSYFHPVTPKVVTISQLNASYQNQLIELRGVEFANGDAGQPFANGFTKTSLSRTVKNCTGGTLETYNSGYSLFANQLTPAGKGTMVAIYSVYNTTGQLLIRDPSDLHMDSTRCGGGGGGTGGTGIMAVRNLYNGSDVTLPQGQKIRGVVISDRANANTDPKNLIVQDSTGGIILRFSSNHSFDLNDSVLVDVSGLNYTSYFGLYEIENVPAGNVTKLGSGTINPRIATTADVQANSELWQSTLVTIQNAAISGSDGIYKGTKTLTDLSGTLAHYTRNTAGFANDAIPTTTKSFTGTIGVFSGAPQLSIRRLSDVQ